MTAILCLIFQIFIMKSTASQLAGYEKVETATIYYFRFIACSVKICVKSRGCPTNWSSSNLRDESSSGAGGSSSQQPPPLPSTKPPSLSSGVKKTSKGILKVATGSVTSAVSTVTTRYDHYTRKNTPWHPRPIKEPLIGWGPDSCWEEWWTIVSCDFPNPPVFLSPEIFRFHSVTYYSVRTIHKWRLQELVIFWPLPPCVLVSMTLSV